MSARWQQIRSRARELRQAYAQACGTEVPDALAVDELAELVCELTPFDDPMLDPRINGELNTVIGSIRLRPGLDPARRRFIIAHELGHYALEGASTSIFEDDDTTIDERAAGEQTGDTDVVQAYNTRERHEQEANLFALDLLIPAQTLWDAVQQPGWTIEELVARFAVSSDALLTQLINVCFLEPVVAAFAEPEHTTRSVTPDAGQQAAVDAPLPTLVIAGPGTGKTRSIVAKYLDLIVHGVDPASILALTFSNRAAEEMRDRIIQAMGVAHPEAAGRVEISTFHAWGLNFLRSYGHHIGLPLDAQLRSRGDLYVLLRRRVEEFPLAQYRMLHDPGYYLGDLMSAVSRAKDELCDVAAYRALAEAEAIRRVTETEHELAGKMTRAAQQARDTAQRDAARLRELAVFYERYELLLRAEGILDYGDLLMRAVEALRLPAVAAELHARYHYILVDEFQDINYASGELVSLLDGGRGRVWAVGDPWQSIYRFRGASPANLQEFPDLYPGATVAPLSRNYRSLQPILDASHAIMANDPLAATRAGLLAARATVGRRPVVEWLAPDGAAETAAIAHAILRRVGGHAARAARCVPPLASHSLRRTRGRIHMWPRRRWRFADHVVLCRTHPQAARVTAALAAHGIPVDVVADIYARPEVKDVLAICALTRSSSGAAMLRALTLPDHLLTADDFTTLVREAREHKRSLPRAARDPEVLARLSPAARAMLQDLHAMLGELAREWDAWQVLTRYLFAWSAATRQRIRRAAAGDWRARQELLALGELIGAARAFVRQAPPAERDVRSFVAYVRLLIEGGETTRMPPMPAGADVVRVMTIHAAKGLEFPIVYVPFLQQGQFPPRAQGSSIPSLPGLAHGLLPDALQEERYLLYVAMTRAQDRLILSRAAVAREKAAERSTLLGPDGEGLAWPLRRMPPASGCARGEEAARLAVTPAIRMPLAASSLDTYAECPRRFLYQYGYNLYDDLSPYLRMHQTIRDGVNRLTELARDGGLPATEQELNDLLWGIFARHELAQVVYTREYFAEAFGHVRQVWADLRSGALRAEAVRQRQVVQRPAGAISADVDRVEEDGASPRWVRVKSGREGNDDHLDTRVMVYARAYEEAHQRPAAIAIHYTASDQIRPVTVQPKVLERHWEKIDTHLEGIAAGRWEPAIGDRCKTCPFNLICPI